MYLTMKEKQAVIEETNFQALFLLEYYLSVIGRDNYIIDDIKTATATGLTLRSVQDNRRLLEKKNIFSIIKTTGGGVTCYLYCARKEGVYCKKYFDRLFGYNTVRDVCRNYTRKKVTDILEKSNLNKMETKDITDLLDLYYYKQSKLGKHNP